MTPWLPALLALAAAAPAQQPAPASVDNEWDLRKLVDATTAQSKRLKPILDQADPKNWQNTQAAEAYATQWKSAQNQLQYLSISASNFAREPERMTLALEVYFRLDSLERSLDSFAEGMRKHGNAAVAELLEGVMSENSQNRDRLRQYITELASTKEQEFRIADQEAQRCRATLSRQAPAPPKPAPKKK